MSKVLRFLKSRELYYGMARYSLAALMLSFGMLKILGMQFNTIRPFATWSQPLEKLSGQQLTWAFMGHSMSLQVMMGLLEFIPACLLLFRRTALAGAFLLLPMTIGVFLVNFQMNLWTNTKLDAAFMLAVNVLILLFDKARLRSIFNALFNGNKATATEFGIAIAILALATVPRLLSHHYKNDQNELTGDWFNNGPYAYQLIRETSKGQPLSQPSTTVFFGPNGEYSEMNDSNSKSGSYKLYSIDSKSHIIEISPEEYGPWRGSYYSLSGRLNYLFSRDTLTISNDDGNTWTLTRRAIIRNPD
ncbi:MAG: hypothetical protein KF744_16700 [Taibaiella sp.]|nr:hypothetical protein [Taibaiella sp.]